jgi:hypothetical protein
MENKKSENKTFPLPEKKKSKPFIKKWIKFVWIGFFAVVLGISALFFAVSQGFVGDMPDVKELENPDIYVASEIYSSDNVLLGKFEKKRQNLLHTNNFRRFWFMRFRLKKMNVLRNIPELISNQFLEPLDLVVKEVVVLLLHNS